MSSVLRGVNNLQMPSSPLQMVPMTPQHSARLSVGSGHSQRDVNFQVGRMQGTPVYVQGQATGIMVDSELKAATSSPEQVWGPIQSYDQGQSNMSTMQRALGPMELAVGLAAHQGNFEQEFPQVEPATTELLPFMAAMQEVSVKEQELAKKLQVHSEVTTRMAETRLKLMAAKRQRDEDKASTQ